MQVVTLNTWGVPNRIQERTELMAETLSSMGADVVCLQEVASPMVKQELRRRLGQGYHVISANHSSLEYPLMAYLPSIGFCYLAYMLSASYSMCWYSWFAIICGLATMPQIVTTAILIGMKYPESTDDDGRFDFMGNTILARKDRFQSLEIVRATPFQRRLRGYPTELCPVWWFQTCFLRPNFMLVRCVDKTNPLKTTLIVANVHLVLGQHNRFRYWQVLEVLRAVEVAKAQFGCSNVLICGDFNAHHDEPEIHLLRRHGYHDAASAGNGVFNEDTWDPVNPNTDGQGERHRIDYIFHSDTFRTTTTSRCFDRSPFCSDHYGVRSEFVASH